jgi:hypothetical protein
MSFHIGELETWPRVRQSIERERRERQNAFMRARDYEAVIRLQSWIEAFDWVLAEARPKPLREEDNE